jgi:hypothetical protein
MEFLHRHNWHYMEPNPWLEHGKIHYWCHWCGLRSVENIPDKSKEIRKSNDPS